MYFTTFHRWTRVYFISKSKKMLSTEDVFSNFSSHHKILKRNDPVSVRTKTISDWVKYGNDLEAVATKIVPEIRTLQNILKIQKGTKIVGMSGSGATCFATFNTEKDCMAASKVVNSKGMWSVSTRIKDFR